MDRGYAHEFTFNEAISFIVYCDSQEETDYYWDRLSHVTEAFLRMKKFDIAGLVKSYAGQ